MHRIDAACDVVLQISSAGPRKTKFGMITHLRKKHVQHHGGALAGSVVPSLGAVGMMVRTEIQ